MYVCKQVRDQRSMETNKGGAQVLLMNKNKQKYLLLYPYILTTLSHQPNLMQSE